MKSLILSILSVLIILLFQNEIVSIFPQEFVNEREQLTSLVAHPMLEEYKQLESRFDVDLGHAYFAETKRAKKSLFDLDVWSSDNLENKFDVLILGDSTQAWGLDVITVSKVSGLHVGQLAWESSVLNPISAAFFEKVVPCLLKKNGLIIVSFAVAFLDVDPADNRRWIKDQDKLVHSGIDSCRRLETYVDQHKMLTQWEGGFAENMFSHSGWRGNLDELSFVLNQRLPGTRYSIPFDFFVEHDAGETLEEISGGKVFSMSKGTTITLTEATEEITFKSKLEPIDFEKSYAQWKLEDEASKNNIRVNTSSLDRLDTDYQLCFAKPVAHRDEDSVRVGSWYDFSVSGCMINFEAILISYLGIDKILMHSSYHYGNETGQIMSIALGKFLRSGSLESEEIVLNKLSLNKAKLAK